MIVIYTPERAERLTRCYDGRPGYVVHRLVEERPAIRSRTHGEIIIATRVYARIYKGTHHRFDITYETIDAGSVIW
jgi:hypothetical protein